jgi:hypothetical protein
MTFRIQIFVSANAKICLISIGLYNDTHQTMLQLVHGPIRVTNETVVKKKTKWNIGIDNTMKPHIVHKT